MPIKKGAKEEGDWVGRRSLSHCGMGDDQE